MVFLEASFLAKPKTAPWRTTLFPNHEKMMIFYGIDRVGEDEGETMCESGKRRHSPEEATQTVNDIAKLVELDGQGSHSPEQDNSLAANSVCSKRTKRVSKKQANNSKELTRAIYAVAEAFNRGNDAILQGNIILQKIANTK